MARATSLAQYALANPEAMTPDGQTVQQAIVDRAIDLYRQGISPNLGTNDRGAFATAIQKDGISIDSGEEKTALPRPAWPRPARSPPTNSPTRDTPPLFAKPQNRKVFIVHGHDDAAREKVARLLERLEFEAIILHERANQGRTIIEKWGEAQAVRYITDLDNHLQTFFETPALWRKLPGNLAVPADLAPDAYVSHHGRHYLFFRKLSNDRIGIISLLHDRMDVPVRLAEDLQAFGTPSEDS